MMLHVKREWRDEREFSRWLAWQPSRAVVHRLRGELADLRRDETPEHTCNVFNTHMDIISGNTFDFDPSLVPEKIKAMHIIIYDTQHIYFSQQTNRNLSIYHHHQSYTYSVSRSRPFHIDCFPLSTFYLPALVFGGKQRSWRVSKKNSAVNWPSLLAFCLVLSAFEINQPVDYLYFCLGLLRALRRRPRLYHPVTITLNKRNLVLFAYTARKQVPTKGSLTVMLLQSKPWSSHENIKNH